MTYRVRNYHGSMRTLCMVVRVLHSVRSCCNGSALLCVKHIQLSLYTYFMLTFDGFQSLGIRETQTWLQGGAMGLWKHDNLDSSG